MPGTRSADPLPAVEVFPSLAALPPAALGLLEGAAPFFSTRAWWDAVLSHAQPAGRTPWFAVTGGGISVFPMLRGPAGEAAALTTPYTCLYEPPGAPAGLDALARHCRRFATTRFDALPTTLADAIAAAGRRAGLVPARFAHFGTWYEDVAGLDWPGYLARRPGALRETIRRRARRAERLEGASFQLVRDAPDLDAGIVAFEAVYARSWKEPEPFPLFNAAQIRAAASLGIARLGVWTIGGVPAAAQVWIIENGRATVLKLAHDETFRAHSPGTVLTAWMIRHMLEQEHATTLDFGRGDDPYKRDWVSGRVQREGVIWINPLRAAGLAALTRHGLGRLRARFRRIG